MKDDLLIIFCEELLERLLERFTEIKETNKGDLDLGIMMGYNFSMSSALNLAFSLGILEKLDKKWQDFEPEDLMQ